MTSAIVRRLLGPVLPLLALAAAAASAQTPATPAAAPSGAHADAPVAQAARTPQAPRIDGRLDEAAWAAATPITEFTQLDPAEGRPASERTEVRILYDDDALYVGARLHDRHPVSARLGRRDMNMSESDWLTVILDSYHDHRSAFGFEINPLGVRRDQTRSDTREDDSWDPVWEAATSVDSGGWTAELRIPFSQLRFSRATEQTWGLQVERQIARTREFANWSFTPRTERGGIPRFGHLAGLSQLQTGKRLEVLPYTLARAEHVDRRGNPYRQNDEYTVSAGVDLKYRLTSNLTLDATINPDFGQVEVDPSVVNLTAVETRFQEKRPFFVEGADIFSFGSGGGNSVFYSRRIGREPQLRLGGYPVQYVPEATRILGAAKISGQMRGGWSIGVLNALTRREEGRFRDAEGVDHATPVEPLTNYFLGRVRKLMRGGNSALGGFVGTVNRDLETELLRDALRSAGYSGGVDFRHEWDARNWRLTGFVAGSHIEGSPAVIRAAQRSPARYFQRPDATHLELDSAATSMSGVAAELSLTRQVGRHWTGSLTAGTTGPGYEVNDLGFQYRADRVDAQARLTYQETRPGRHLRRWAVSTSARAERNYDWDDIMNALFLNVGVQGLSYWSADLRVNATASALHDRLTRGGPAARRPGNVSLFLRADTDNRRRVIGEIVTSYERDDAGGWEQSLGLSLQTRPAAHWELNIGPYVTRSRSDAQYLRTVPDPAAAATYGARYVFAPIEQRTFSLDTRLNYTFSPTLSVQLFAQPFISSADFGPPAELRAPRTYEFLTYGRDVGEVEPLENGAVRIHPRGRGPDAPSFTVGNPDFNLRNLRGNAVVRWEWNPGSTLFLVWQQVRSDRARVGDFSFSRDRAALFDTRPDNVFVVKVNYWLNP